jgi:hypothetical protein
MTHNALHSFFSLLITYGCSLCQSVRLTINPYIWMYKCTAIHTSIYKIHATCRTHTRLKSHHKWAYQRLWATQLRVILPPVLHRKGSKGPRKPIRGPYTDRPALSQKQSKTSSRHFLRQTEPSKGRPETTSVIDNVSKNKTCPASLFFCVFFYSIRGQEGGEKGEYQSCPSSFICRHPVYMMTNKTGSNPDRVVASLKNIKQTKQGYPTSILDHPCDTRSVPWRDPKPK